MLLQHKILFLPLFLAGALSAQQELMLHQLPELWHANSTNPAYFPEGKRFAIGLPSFGLDVQHSGKLSYRDVFRHEGDRNILDFGRAIDKLDPENNIAYSQRLETVSFGWRIGGGWALQAGHALRRNAYLAYPKSMVEVLWNGNAPYLNQTLDIAPTANFYDWHELGVGVSKQAGPVRLGARFKYLGGISAIQSDKEHQTATVYTDSDYYLTLTTDYGFSSAYTVQSIDTAGLGFDVVNDPTQGKIFSSSNGWAVDLGATAQVGKRLSISVAALDLGGKITWRDDRAAYFRSNGVFTYEGITFPGTDLLNGLDSLDLKGELDSLNDIFHFQKTPREFSSTLPARFYVGFAYKLTQRWRLGLTLYHENGDDRKTTAVSANAQWTPLRWLSLGALYGVNDRSAANIGFNVIVKVGPVQVYGLSDNLLTALTPYASPAVNFRVGAGVAF